MLPPTFIWSGWIKAWTIQITDRRAENIDHYLRSTIQYYWLLNRKVWLLMWKLCEIQLSFRSLPWRQNSSMRSVCRVKEREQKQTCTCVSFPAIRERRIRSRGMWSGRGQAGLSALVKQGLSLWEELRFGSGMRPRVCFAWNFFVTSRGVLLLLCLLYISPLSEHWRIKVRIPSTWLNLGCLCVGLES